LKQPLKDKVVVITGGAGGLGLALAKEAVALGASLALLDLNLDALHEAERNLKDLFPAVQVSLHPIDISQPSLWVKTSADILAVHGAIDILVNNAGITLAPQPIENIQSTLYDRVVAVNLLGAIYAVRACLPLILKSPQGGVINIGSLAGQIGLYGYSPYCVSKFGLRGLGEGLQMEFAGAAHRCLNVYPGGIKTNIMKNALGMAEDKREAMHRSFIKQASIGPEQAAKKVWRAYLGGQLNLIMGLDAWVIILIRKCLGKWGLKLLKKAFDFQAQSVK